MKATVEKLEKNKVKLEIEVAAQEFDKAMQKAYLKNRSHIAIPGFRKGKAPRKVIENYYGESVFFEDAINEACPQAYDQAVEHTGINPVDHPDIDIVQIGEGQDLIFTAEVTVKPEVELGQYKGIEIKKVEYNVTESEVEERVNQVCEQNARWIDVEDGIVQEGNRLTIDYKGYVDGEAFDGGTADNQILEIGSGRFIPGFEEQLIGMEQGEGKEIKVVFPEDYHAEDLQGKEATFIVNIHEIKAKELPALDDDFAKDVSEFDTLQEYKQDIYKSMEDSAQKKAESEMENELLDKVSKNAEIEIPEIMVETEIDNMIREMDYQMRFQGLNVETYLQMMGMTIENFRAQYHDQAYNRVKTQMVLEKISEQEEIIATEEDLEKEYTRMAEQYNMDIEKIKEDYSKHEKNIKEGLAIQKTIDFLMEQAVIIEGLEEDVEQETNEEGDEE